MIGTPIATTQPTSKSALVAEQRAQHPRRSRHNVRRCA
jgi:hypothetical protein